MGGVALQGHEVHGAGVKFWGSRVSRASLVPRPDRPHPWSESVGTRVHVHVQTFLPLRVRVRALTSHGGGVAARQQNLNVRVGTGVLHQEYRARSITKGKHFIIFFLTG